MAVNIGFDDEDLTDVTFQDDNNPEAAKDQIEKAEEKFKKVVFTEKRVSQFLEDYDCSVVNDFGDDFHYTDEERQKKNKYYETFQKLRRYKHKYKRLDQFVVAMREALKCLDIVAEDNGVFNPDKFKTMFMKGDIVICGLTLPKLTGRVRKYISFDYLTDFILSDKDPSELTKKNVDDVYTDEDLDKMSDTLLTDDEIKYYETPLTEKEEQDNTKAFDPDDDDPFDRNIVTEISTKSFNKFIKEYPEVARSMKQIRDEKRSLDNMAAYAYELSSDDFDQISRYDRIHNIDNSEDAPEFHGDILDDDDYDKFMFEADEWERNNSYLNYHGKIKSFDEVNELEVKSALEANGWNLRKMFNNEAKEKLLKKKIKRDKKREKELRNQLMEIDRRKKRREGRKLGEDIDDYDDEVDRKKIKKAKKKMKKNSKKFLDSFNDFDEDEVLDWKM